MIEYTLNQRHALRWNGSDWVEEVLAASGAEVDNTGWSLLSGDNVQEALDSVDNVLSGIDYSNTASGIVPILDVSNVSGVSGTTLGDLEVISLGASNDSIFRFSFSVAAQPVDPVHIRVLLASHGVADSGTVSLQMDYNLFDQGSDLTPGSFAFSTSGSIDLVTADFEELRLITLTIPASNFSSVAAPIIATCQITRDTSVVDNYGDAVAIVAVYADNVPGGVQGNTAGYLGGNLTVDGNLTVEGNLLLENSYIPASGSAAGVSGTVAFDDDYAYFCVATNTWKRAILSDF